MIKESQSGSISFILEPVEFDEQGRATAWVPVLDPNTVQEKILAWNQKHFAQAAGTPFATKEMEELLGEAATSAVADDILDGNPDMEWLNQQDEAVKAILSNMKKLTEEPIDIELTTDDVASGFAKWKEETSTSPSECHLGHYKSISKEHPEEEVEEARKRMLEIQTKMMNLAISHSFVYERWQIDHSLMLAKSENQR